MRIVPKLQQGGLFGSSFAVYQNIPEPRESSERREREDSDKKSKKDDDEIGYKDLLKLVDKLDALPNDGRAFGNALIATLRNAQYSTDKKNLSQTLMLSIAENMQLLNDTKYNKEQFDETYKRAVENQSLDDFAMYNGHVVVFNKEKRDIDFLTPEQYLKRDDSNKYTPLTVANILKLRAESPQFVGQNSLFNYVEGSYGLNKIHQFIKDSFYNIGKTEQSSDIYITKDVIKGQQELEKMIEYGPEGYYKYTSSINTSSDAQIHAVANYIYQMLPINAKARIALETKDGKRESVENFILNSITGTVDQKVSKSFDYIGNDAKLSGKTQDPTDKVTDNYATKIIKGYGTDVSFTIDLGDGTKTFLTAKQNPIAGKDDNLTGSNTSVWYLTQSTLGASLDLNSMSIGGKIISSQDLRHIVNEDGNLVSIDYPCENRNGRIVPNISQEYIEKKKKVDEDLKKSGINPGNLTQEYISQHYNEINTAYANNELEPPYLPDGNFKNDSYARFILIKVNADADIVKGANQHTIKPLDDRAKKNVIDYLKEFDKNYQEPSSFFRDKNFYSTFLWIRLRPGYNASTATDTLNPAITKDKDNKDQIIANKAQLITHI